MQREKPVIGSIFRPGGSGPIGMYTRRLTMEMLDSPRRIGLKVFKLHSALFLRYHR